jgi:chloramphenicol-sensitive protein RarD
MRKGILFATFSYAVWGLFPLYFHALHEVMPLQIMLHRVVWSLLFLAVVLIVRRQWEWIKAIRTQPRQLWTFVASSLLLSSNWFCYIWAVHHGRVLDGSLGYFINPLVSVLLGQIFLKERLRSVQWLAVAFAAAGVLWLALLSGHPPWIGLTLALTFGTYGLLRKTATLGSLEGLTLETLLLFPFAIGYLAWLSTHGENAFGNASANTQWLLAAAGPITAIPLLLFAAAARRIPLASLGLLQYIAPTIQFILGVWFFNEAFTHERLIGFGAIWLGLLVYSGEGLWLAYRERAR